jgi:hypothetical protein
MFCGQYLTHVVFVFLTLQWKCSEVNVGCHYGINVVEYCNAELNVNTADRKGDRGVHIQQNWRPCWLFLHVQRWNFFLHRLEFARAVCFQNRSKRRPLDTSTQGYTGCYAEGSMYFGYYIGCEDTGDTVLGFCNVGSHYSESLANSSNTLHLRPPFGLLRNNLNVSCLCITVLFNNNVHCYSEVLVAKRIVTRDAFDTVCRANPVAVEFMDGVSSLVAQICGATDDESIISGGSSGKSVNV